MLSHLAILAREARVPTVVGYAGATEDLPEGAIVLVDGDTGQVTIQGHGVDLMKIIAWLAGIGTLLAGAVYMVVSLNRWEWNRALFFGLIVLIAEIGLATGLILRRLARLEHMAKRDADPAVRQILSETRPPRRDRFVWMRESTGQFNVFITFLVGGGVILSGIAWLVDRIASNTSSPAGEERLARQLYPISYPSGGLLLDDVTVLAQEVPGADDAQIRQLLRRGGRP